MSGFEDGHCRPPRVPSLRLAVTARTAGRSGAGTHLLFRSSSSVERKRLCHPPTTRLCLLILTVGWRARAPSFWQERKADLWQKTSGLSPKRGSVGDLAAASGLGTRCVLSHRPPTGTRG